ncbi:hypothetical protein ACFQAT_08055 [Undibacterium arcticum]|uniref:Uncharacterized protein n=2 Tax=Undibacterium arcticum TaxID=1762892 RepID=A0ABV7F8N7_9BURK
MSKMRAKMQVGFVQEHFYGPEKSKSQETLAMHAVAASKYPEDGSDEDNTFAKFSPGANLSINIANPALFGQFKVGEKYYVDFTAAPD